MIQPKLRETASLTLVWVQVPYTTDDTLVNQFTDERFAQIHTVQGDLDSTNVIEWMDSAQTELLAYVRHAGPNQALVLAGWNIGATVAQFVADLYPHNVVGLMSFGDPYLPTGILYQRTPLVGIPIYNTQWRYVSAWDGDPWFDEAITSADVKYCIRDMFLAYVHCPGSDGFGRQCYANGLWDMNTANTETYHRLANVVPGVYSPNAADAMVQLEDTQLFRVVGDE